MKIIPGANGQEKEGPVVGRRRIWARLAVSGTPGKSLGAPRPASRMYPLVSGGRGKGGSPDENR
jgi:hypothetical protein